MTQTKAEIMTPLHIQTHCECRCSIAIHGLTINIALAPPHTCRFMMLYYATSHVFPNWLKKGLRKRKAKLHCTEERILTQLPGAGLQQIFCSSDLLKTGPLPPVNGRKGGEAGNCTNPTTFVWPKDELCIEHYKEHGGKRKRTTDRFFCPGLDCKHKLCVWREAFCTSL